MRRPFPHQPARCHESKLAKGRTTRGNLQALRYKGQAKIEQLHEVACKGQAIKSNPWELLRSAAQWDDVEFEVDNDTFGGGNLRVPWFVAFTPPLPCRSVVCLPIVAFAFSV